MTQESLQYSSPLTFTFKQRMILAVVPRVIVFLIKMIMFTCRIEVRDEHGTRTKMLSGTHYVGGFWHESTALIGFLVRNTNYHTLTSYSFDGELAARVSNAFGMRALRGSTSRGGMKAVQQLAAAAPVVPGIGLTLDGPRGPRRVVKPGLAMTSAKSRVPIITVAVAITRCKRLNSWDRFILPLPFARIVYSYGPEMQPPVSVEREDVERKTLEVQEQLQAMQRELDEELGLTPYEVPTADATD